MVTPDRIEDAESSIWTPIMKRVVHHACLSPDPSTQNAAVLLDVDYHGSSIRPVRDPQNNVIEATWAVNEFPEGVRYEDERWVRPGKYSWIEHAERGAIYAAARAGISTRGTTMVCPWATCDDCARGIIRSGVKHLVTLKPVDGDTNDRWQASIEKAMVMLSEARIPVTFLQGHCATSDARCQ